MEFLQGLLGAATTFIQGKAGEAAGKAQAEKEMYERKERETERKMKWDMFLKEYGLKKEDLDLRRWATEEELKLKREGLEIERGKLDATLRELGLKEGTTIMDLITKSTEEANQLMGQLIAAGVRPDEALQVGENFLAERFRLFEETTGRKITIPQELLRFSSRGLRNKVAMDMLRNSNETDPQKLRQNLVNFLGSEEEADQLLSRMGVNIEEIAKFNSVRSRLAALQVEQAEANLTATQWDNIKKQFGITEDLVERLNKFIQSDMDWKRKSHQEKVNLLRQIVAPYRRLLPITDEELNTLLNGYAHIDNLNAVKVQLEQLSISTQRYAATLQFRAAQLQADNRHLLEALGKDGNGNPNQTPLFSGGSGTVNDYNLLDYSFGGLTVLGGNRPGTTHQQAWGRITQDVRLTANQLANSVNNPALKRFYEGAAKGSLVDLNNQLAALATNRVPGQSVSDWNGFFQRNKDNLRAGWLAFHLREYQRTPNDPEGAERRADAAFNSLIGSVFGVNTDYATIVKTAP